MNTQSSTMLIDGKEWKLVPVEPTGAMCEAAERAAQDATRVAAQYVHDGLLEPGAALSPAIPYRAMLSAAPQPPVLCRVGVTEGEGNNGSLAKNGVAACNRPLVAEEASADPDDVTPSPAPVQPPEGGTGWPVLPCRFSARGCQDHAVGIFHVPEGCHCWPDPIQALCAQHACKADSPGPIVCVIDFSIPSPPGQDDRTDDGSNKAQLPDAFERLSRAIMRADEFEKADCDFLCQQLGLPIDGPHRPHIESFRQQTWSVACQSGFAEAQLAALPRKDVEGGWTLAENLSMRMQKYADRFRDRDRAGHAEVIERWMVQIAELLAAERSRVIEECAGLVDLHAREAAAENIHTLPSGLKAIAAAIRDLGKQTGGAE